MIAATVGGPLFGYIADRFGRNKSLQAATILVGLSSLCVSVVQNPTQMFLARLLVGHALGGMWTSGMTLVSESWNPKTRGKAVAIVQVGVSPRLLICNAVLQPRVTDVWLAWCLRGLCHSSTAHILC